MTFPSIARMRTAASRMGRSLVLGALAVIAASCTHATAINTAATTVSTTEGLKAAQWASNVTVTYEDGYVRYRSNGLPNHARQAEYAVPTMGGMGVPTTTTARAMADPTRAQSYDFRIPTTPRKASSPTSTSLGTIGVMISGAALFNPYEGDGVTVAMASNFTVANARGEAVAFLDSCNGHPTPLNGMYHYHALPPCVTATVDQPGGPSHLIGIAFDGYPIYGNRDINGRQLTAADLDRCGGVTSATPEYPDGIYHYVLLPTTTAESSIRCSAGEVAITQMVMR